MMQVFNATVRIGGMLEQEVLKRGITVPEIIVLRRLHGNDGVINIKHVGYADVDAIDERERLDYIYGNGLSHLHEDQKTSIEKLFGGDYTPIPEELREYEGKFVDKEDDLEEFQKPEPYSSPAYEDRATAIRKKAEAKRADKKEFIKNTPVASARKDKKSALESVL